MVSRAACAARQMFYLNKRNSPSERHLAATETMAFQAVEDLKLDAREVFIW